MGLKRLNLEGKKCVHLPLSTGLPACVKGAAECSPVFIWSKYYYSAISLLKCLLWAMPEDRGSSRKSALSSLSAVLCNTICSFSMIPGVAFS